jgi:glycosyltransferase involved in cell wall biosynthesis
MSEGTSGPVFPSRMGTSITLAMIVKNEAHVIERCLASVRPLLSHWIVVDTGSTDGTQDVIRRVMQDLPGAVHDRPWRGFGASRTEALELARGKADYALVIDADDMLELDDGFTVPTLDQDSYLFEVRLGELRYKRAQLFRLAKPWRYVGVVHEYAHCDEPASRGVLQGVIYTCHRDGARSHDPRKYQLDAEVLEQAMKDEPDNGRHVFYGAQSWRDAGHDARARTLYEKRATMGGFDEEVYSALVEAAKAADRLGEPAGVVLAAYLRAYQARPTRAEPLYELARYCRLRQDFALAWLFASAGVEIPPPEADVLFFPADVYAWRIHDEHALAAHWTGRYEIARAVNERLLKDRRLPETEVARIRDNLEWAERGLSERQKK